MTLPIWFLDIDGVINSLGAPLPESDVDTAIYKLAHIAAGPPDDQIIWPINYSPKVVDFINEVNRTGLAEVRWLTTWEQQARTRFAPGVGLDEFPSQARPDGPSVADFPADARSGRVWWKESVVRTILNKAPRPYVWTDDDLERSVRESVQGDFTQSSLLIRPSINGRAFGKSGMR